MIPKINQNQLCKNMAKMCFKIDVKSTLFLMLGVTVWCYTPVLHLKWRVLGIKKIKIVLDIIKNMCYYYNVKQKHILKKG